MFLLRYLATFVLWLFGWTTEDFPAGIHRAVVVCSPHTSYWDGFWGICYKIKSGLPIRCAMKKEALPSSLHWVLRAFDVILIDRNKKYKDAKHHNTVQTIVALFRTGQPLLLGIAPEGTRKKINRWRPGFYHIATQAHVPIVLCAMDYNRGQIFFKKVLYPTGNYETDLKKIQTFYRETVGKVGRYPEQGI